MRAIGYRNKEKKPSLPPGGRAVLLLRQVRRLALPALFSFALPCAFAGDAGNAGDAPVRSLIEMRHANVVIQKWDISCGAAALTTLLNHQHGENLTEKEVAVILMKRPEYIDHPELIRIREGFSLLDLKRFVEARGYKGIGFGKMTLEDLLAKAPILTPIKVNGYNHFVVFRGMRGNRVLLADPAWGNRTMLSEQFVESWIDYPEMGRVGLAVLRADGTNPEVTPLTPREEDFVMLR